MIFNKPPTLKQTKQAGFTLIEILVICPILMAVITFMISYLFRQFGQLTKQNVQINLQVEAQTDIFNIQDDVFFANAFVSTINSNLTDTYAPSGGWKNSTNPTQMIISTPASTANHRYPNRQPVYINTFGCTPASVLQQNDILYDNIVIFASGTNLYKRIITAPGSLSTCGTDYRHQTCPAANATQACKADILLSSHLSSLTFTYLNSNGAIVTIPEQATVVKAALVLSDVGFGDVVTGSSTITLRRLNQ